MAKKKKSKKAKKPKKVALEVYCLYRRDWIPMGRSKKKCPVCGAVVGGSLPAHELRKAQTNLLPAASPDGPEGRCRC